MDHESRPPVPASLVANRNLLIVSEISFTFAMFMALYIYFMQKLRTMSYFKDASGKSLKNIVVRINSSIHAALMTIAAIHIVFYDPDLSTSKITYSTYEIYFTLNFVIGYMLYDIVLMCIYREIFDLSSIGHHLVSIIAYFACSRTDMFALTGIFRLISEASTPFINARWILLELKKTQTKLYFYNGLVILALFGLVRVLVIPVHWYIIFMYTKAAEWSTTPLFLRTIGVTAGIPLDVLNVFWYFKIVRNAKRHLNTTKANGLNKDQQQAEINNNNNAELEDRTKSS